MSCSAQSDIEIKTNIPPCCCQPRFAAQGLPQDRVEARTFQSNIQQHTNASHLVPVRGIGRKAAPNYQKHEVEKVWVQFTPWLAWITPYPGMYTLSDPDQITVQPANQRFEVGLLDTGVHTPFSSPFSPATNMPFQFMEVERATDLQPSRRLC